MADQFDRAQELDALAQQSAMNAHQLKAAQARKLVAIGECLNPACGEPFDNEPARLFCNPQCGAEHARRAKP